MLKYFAPSKKWQRLEQKLKLPQLRRISSLLNGDRTSVTECGGAYDGCMQMPTCVQSAVMVRKKKKTIKRMCAQTIEQIRDHDPVRDVADVIAVTRSHACQENEE